MRYIFGETGGRTRGRARRDRLASHSLSTQVTTTTSLRHRASGRDRFVNQPKDAFIGSTITGSPFNSAGSAVSVHLLQNGTDAAGDERIGAAATTGVRDCRR